MLLSVLCGVIFLNSAFVAGKYVEKINTTVYYESLCPFARNFIINQLYPALHQGNLSKYLNLELIPYGKANRSSDSPFDTQFWCQHGPNECYANLIQGCARDLIGNGEKTDLLGYNVQHLDFVNCFMKNISSLSSTNQINKAVDYCAKPHVISASHLRGCANNSFGINSLIQYGRLTDRFQYPLKNVPTIVFNGDYDEKESEQAQENLIGVLCGKITEPKPPECKRVKFESRNMFRTTTTSSTTSFSCSIIIDNILLFVSITFLKCIRFCSTSIC